MSECPCRWCNERNSDCHSVCDKYKNWAAENEVLRHKRNINAKHSSSYIEDRVEQCIKYKKRRGIIK